MLNNSNVNMAALFVLQAFLVLCLVVFWLHGIVTECVLELSLQTNVFEVCESILQ